MNNITLPVRFNPSTPQQYDIIIGNNILKNPDKYLSPLLARAKVAIVTDEHVAAFQLEPFTNSLKEAGINFDTIIIPAGEESKKFKTLEMILSKLLAFGIERRDAVIALGGGVVGDITGFACSMLRRGCQFIQAPTTILAQVDSSVGGKTAINSTQGKNLIGAFYQPRAVFTDIDTLSTLPQRERRAGYAEIVKYGLLGDREFFEWLEKHGKDVLALEVQSISYAVRRSCEMKAQIVEADERENGKRALLNLGHTFGHALEGAYGFSSKLIHGEGVSIGMVLAFEYAAAHQQCPHSDVTLVKDHLQSVGCPTEITDIVDHHHLSADRLMELMMQDKKVEDGNLTLILPNAIGNAVIKKDIPTSSVHAFWKQHLTT